MTPEAYAEAAQSAGDQWWLGVVILGALGLVAVVLGLVAMGLLESRAARQRRKSAADLDMHFETTPHEPVEPRVPTQRRQSGLS